MNFVHLHNHTDASPDGLASPLNFVKSAKEKGFDALSITDHGTMANHIPFYRACLEHGIKPILGVESYVMLDGQMGHITLIAKNEKGYENLIDIQNKAHKSNYKRPAFEISDLLAGLEDVICLSGCVSSPLQKLSPAESLNLAMRLKGVFGNNFYIEIMTVLDETTSIERSLQLSKDLQIPLVLTNDCHFLEKEQVEIHQHVTQIKAGWSYRAEHLYLKTQDELEARAKSLGFDLTDAINNTRLISDSITPPELRRSPALPHIDHAFAKLCRKVFLSLKERKLGNDYKERLKLELSVIRSMGFETYFLILDCLITFAKENNIRVGPGRGSGAGSLTLYLLGVTDIDPLYFDLSFERFLNKDRKEYPDVDVDFESEKRDQIIEFAAKTWQAKPVSTYSTYAHKVLIHDIWRNFKLSRETSQKVADSGLSCMEYKEAVKEHPEIPEIYKTMSGTIRHTGKHAGGIIITDVKVPIENGCAAWSEGMSNHYLSYAGIVKFDLLGISVLSLLRRLETRTGKKAEFPSDHHPVFSLFQTGKTTGIFQFGSGGIVELTKRIHPETFEELVILNALYRPGTINAGVTDEFHLWKKSPRKLHPLIDDLLEKTYGAILYQEQVMAIFARITDVSFTEADLMRRLISKAVGDKSLLSELEKAKKQFFEGCKKKGIDPKPIWDEIETHTGYSFNRSHAVSYAMLAWQTAWFKYYYMPEFYCELLNIDTSNEQNIIFSAVEEGLEFLMPDVNSPETEYTLEDGKIKIPLSAVKFCGLKGAMEIKALAPFSDKKDFLARVPKRSINVRTRKHLFYAGAFNSLTGDMQVEPQEEPPFNFVIPSKETLARIKRAYEIGAIGGLVIDIKKKKSKFGDYNVYVLKPDVSVWKREETDIKKGDLIFCKINNHHKILELRIVK